MWSGHSRRRQSPLSRPSRSIRGRDQSRDSCQMGVNVNESREDGHSVQIDHGIGRLRSHRCRRCNRLDRIAHHYNRLVVQQLARLHVQEMSGPYQSPPRYGLLRLLAWANAMQPVAANARRAAREEIDQVLIEDSPWGGPHVECNKSRKHCTPGCARSVPNSQRRVIAC